MTLVSAVLTKDFVAQVSDRRLTKGGQPWDDQANKAVILCSHMAFGYSGLAFLGDERVDDWLVRILLETRMGPISEIFRHVINRADSAVANLQMPAIKRHLAIVVTGWVQAHKGGPYIPFIANISNGLDDNWQWTAKAKDDFSYQLVRLDDLDNKDILLYWLGQAVPEDIDSDTRRALRNRREKGGGPRVSVHVLVNAVREVASKNRMVSDNLMAVSIPRNAVGANFMEVSLKDIYPEDQVASQHFFSGSDQGTRYQPHYLGCYKRGFFSITHGKITTGASARRMAATDKSDQFSNEPQKGKDSGELDGRHNRAAEHNG